MSNQYVKNVRPIRWHMFCHTTQAPNTSNSQVKSCWGIMGLWQRHLIYGRDMVLQSVFMFSCLANICCIFERQLLWMEFTLFDYHICLLHSSLLGATNEHILIFILICVLSMALQIGRSLTYALRDLFSRVLISVLLTRFSTKTKFSDASSSITIECK